MKFTQAFITTFRDFPKDAEIPSHQWLVRAGMIVKHAAGIYTYSPLFYRVFKKAASIIEEEMDRAGALQILMPILQPVELWEKSGRLTGYRKTQIMFESTDRKEATYCLSPTAEEVVTEFVSKMITSHKQLPFTVYQQQDKFRDEFRPRSGLLRGREFTMKDAYSFDLDEAGLNESYQKMRDAYIRIFERCDLEYIVVQADSGAIGGTGSEEFMAITESGEDTLLYCEGYAANVEKAVCVIASPDYNEDLKPLRKEPTPDIKTVQQLCDFFDLPAERLAKTILYKAIYQEEEKLFAVMIRGDLEINEVKLANHLDAISVELADEAAVKKATNAEVGFAGPLNLSPDVALLADLSVKPLKNFLCGCCETDYHVLDVNYGRDFPEPEFADFLQAQAGQRSPNGHILQETRGVELGHVFKLGAKYSEPMEAGVRIENTFRPFLMGCYGIGTSRVVASVVEQHYDDRGIQWPVTIAPYHVHIVPVKYNDDMVKHTADELYETLTSKGIEVLLDDRKAAAGVKFADADMLGMPFQVIIGKALSEGNLELKIRKTGEKRVVAIADMASTLETLVREALNS